MRFGLLSTIDSPYLPATIAACKKLGLRDLIVILDRRVIGERDKKIWQERFSVPFDEIDLGAGSIYYQGGSLEVLFCPSHNDQSVINALGELSIGALANVGTPRKIGQALLNAAPHGIINVHPGILPKYRGCSVVEWAMLNGDILGNTAHFMGEGYDDGPIIEIEPYPDLTGAHLARVRFQMAVRTCDLLAKILKRVATELIKPDDFTPQAAHHASYWDPIGPEDMKIVQRIGSS